MIFRFLVIISFLFSFAYAQYGETIRTARPGQAIGAYSLGAKTLQIQTGFTNSFLDNSFNSEFGLEHTPVFRIGIIEKLEASAVFGWKHQSIQFNKIEGEYRNFGVSNTQLGLRYNLLEGKKARPTIGVQARVLFNLQSEKFRRNRTGYRLTLMTGHKITDWYSITTNWGIVDAGNLGKLSGFYIINNSFSLTEKASMFAEVYGTLNNFDWNVDGGFAYLIHKDLQLDISAGWQGRYKKDVHDVFLDFGVSWRTDWRNKLPENVRTTPLF